MAEAARVVAAENGVHDHQLRALRLVPVLFEENVVELHRVVVSVALQLLELAPLQLHQELLDGVLLEVPEPGRVDLSEVLHHQRVRGHAARVGAHHAESLRKGAHQFADLLDLQLLDQHLGAPRQSLQPVSAARPAFLQVLLPLARLRRLRGACAGLRGRGVQRLGTGEHLSRRQQDVPALVPQEVERAHDGVDHESLFALVEAGREQVEQVFARKEVDAPGLADRNVPAHAQRRAAPDKAVLALLAAAAALVALDFGALVGAARYPAALGRLEVAKGLQRLHAARAGGPALRPLVALE